MSNSLEDQTIALSAVFQSAALVKQIAAEGNCHAPSLEVMIESIFNTNPESTIAVYETPMRLNLGLRELRDTLTSDKGRQSSDIIRYALNLIHLESKLSSQQTKLNNIGQRIHLIKEEITEEGVMTVDVMNSLAVLYTETISTFNQRIQVTGKAEHLENRLNVDKIRTLLLAGIRAAVLWRQVGGRRWKLLLKRQAYRDEADRIIHSYTVG